MTKFEQGVAEFHKLHDEMKVLQAKAETIRVMLERMLKSADEFFKSRRYGK